MLVLATVFLVLQGDDVNLSGYYWMNNQALHSVIDICSGDGEEEEEQPELPDPTNPSPTSPIVIDLLQNGFSFGGPDSAIFYDLHGLDYYLHIQWVNPRSDDSFLAVDLNGNGVVDDGSELFGNGTRILINDGGLAVNGFVGLAQWDSWQLGGNEDSVINDQDTVWSDLYLWNDMNADGVSTVNEMTSIHDTSLISLDVIPYERKMFDVYGNSLRFWSTARISGLNDSSSVDMVDVYFRLLSRVRPTSP